MSGVETKRDRLIEKNFFDLPIRDSMLRPVLTDVPIVPVASLPRERTYDRASTGRTGEPDLRFHRCPGRDSFSALNVISHFCREILQIKPFDLALLPGDLEDQMV